MEYIFYVVDLVILDIFTHEHPSDISTGLDFHAYMKPRITTPASITGGSLVIVLTLG